MIHVQISKLTGPWKLGKGSPPGVRGEAGWEGKGE